MGNRFKLRISRMFRSSFGSCRTKNISDVIENPTFFSSSSSSSPQNQRHRNKFHLIEPLPQTPPSPPPPKPARPFPSICKPRHSEVTARCPPFHVSSAAADFDGHKCPPASPVSPLNLFSYCKGLGFYDENKNQKKTKKKNKRVRAKSKNLSSTYTPFFCSSSQESFTIKNYGGWWWSSSEDETDTLFSSRNLSSDSSELSLGRQHSEYRKRCNAQRRRRIRAKNRGSSVVDMGVVEGKNYKVKDSFAVVKRSSDPYNDFRASMVEMIIERQIFAAYDLEQLLQCFLSLNSHHHHIIIIEVFTEIWETLFSNFS